MCFIGIRAFTCFPYMNNDDKDLSKAWIKLGKFVPSRRSRSHTCPSPTYIKKVRKINFLLHKTSKRTKNQHYYYILHYTTNTTHDKRFFWYGRMLSGKKKWASQVFLIVINVHCMNSFFCALPMCSFAMFRFTEIKIMLLCCHASSC